MQTQMMAKIHRGTTTAATILVFSLDDSFWLTAMRMSREALDTTLDAMHCTRPASLLVTGSILRSPSVDTEWRP